MGWFSNFTDLDEGNYERFRRSVPTVIFSKKKTPTQLRAEAERWKRNGYHLSFAGGIETWKKGFND